MSKFGLIEFGGQVWIPHGRAGSERMWRQRDVNMTGTVRLTLVHTRRPPVGSVYIATLKDGEYSVEQIVPAAVDREEGEEGNTPEEAMALLESKCRQEITRLEEQLRFLKANVT